MPREVQILGLIAQGGTYQGVADELHLAYNTVKNYAASAITKLGANSQAHAVLLACHAGILDGRPQRHGDHAGYAAHLYRGDEPCEACKAGERAYRTELWRRRHQNAA
ncbi:helix-turn-helix transcriptional regulator [Streptomyces sp. NPDC005892]|uniref:response regulator transcription factor n=1 Tax=Streptomyces sp. NPDC005892 TaxID=3155593 RepID=UPI0033F7EED8